MTLLGNRRNIREDDNYNNNYTLPAVLNEDKNVISLKKSIVLSAILHPAVVILGWLVVVVMALLGINLVLFDKPEPKMRDIEFVLVNKEQTPINKNTKYRSDKNSRAGGIHDSKRKVSDPTMASPKQAPSKPAGGAPKKQAPKKSVTQQTFDNLMKRQHKPQESSRRGSENVKPTPTPPVIPKPIPKAGNPPTVAKPTSQFVVPVPKTRVPQVTGPSEGPVSGSRSGSGTSSGSGKGSYTPSPSLSTSGTGSGSGKGRFSQGYSSGSGSAGNPGPGNPKGAPGIDAIKEPDFGPYMRDLQRRIKSNWDPPSGNESKRVVLLFKVSRDGRLISVKVQKSSGVPIADKAAISAVELSAPFRQLPPEFKGASVDIQFTFDYNVFGASIN